MKHVIFYIVDSTTKGCQNKKETESEKSQNIYHVMYI